MRNHSSLRRALPSLALAMLFGAGSAWAASNTAAVKMLSADLPSGVTLARASCPQTAQALGVAVGQHPEMAASLTEAALEARTPRRGQGELDCDCVVRIVRAGIHAAPKRSSEIVQMALAGHPDCADALNALLKDGKDGGNPDNGFGLGPDGYNSPNDYYGQFGIGFGPGFPGSPGFVGSPPSGAIALPPAATQVTPVKNG